MILPQVEALFSSELGSQLASGGKHDSITSCQASPKKIKRVRIHYYFSKELPVADLNKTITAWKNVWKLL